MSKILPKITFAKSAWEIYEAPLERFVDLTVADGYDAVELYLLDRPEKPAQIMRLLAAASLPLIAQIVTAGHSVEEYIRSLESRYEHAIGFNPRFINCHTGKDYYSFDDLAFWIREPQQPADRINRMGLMI